MQEFFAKTVDDFAPERVLNLDENKANNFAVYGENTITAKSTGEVNKVVSADESTRTYVIENPDSTVAGLQNGNILACEQENMEVLIVKVESIEISGNTATITGQDTSMEDVFEYAKIDASQGIADADIDSSNLGEGVTYNGAVSDEEPAQAYSSESSDISEYHYLPTGPTLNGNEVSGTLSVPISYTFLEKQIGDDECNAKLSGDVKLSMEASVKLYLSWTYQYVEVRFDYGLSASITLSGSISDSVPLAPACFSPVPGLYISLTPSFILEVSAKITFEGTLKGTAGFHVSTEIGYNSLTSTPSLDFDTTIDGTVFIGVSLKPAITVISEHIVQLSFDAKVGAEINEKLTGGENENLKTHICKHCINGDVSAKIIIEAKATLLKNKEFKYGLEFTLKLLDFYNSLDHQEKGIGTCPYWGYHVTVEVFDKNGNHINNAAISDPSGKFSGSTGIDGTADFYVPGGTYTITAAIHGKKRAREFTVNGSKKVTIKIMDYTNPTNPTDPTEPTTDPTEPTDPTGSTKQTTDSTNKNNSVKVKQLSAGSWHCGCIDVNGNLYMWGLNQQGQLGNGDLTMDDSTVPIKIMDNVKSVSVGYDHSAAITEDGSLYMWGDNDYGQLGNGTTENSYVPIKIMDNVKAVSLNKHGYTSAAITEDGSLYMWGVNLFGQLGNGEDGSGMKNGGFVYDQYTKKSSVPIKIMDNVKSVSLGYSHSAAITEDGSLYMWGDNCNGELGNGESGYYENNYSKLSNVPIKIMDNVKSVSLGYYHSGAITEDGSLYMWGTNSYGKLGNSKIGYQSTVPIKIMDNVKSISLGYCHSGAITEDGSLYMWGYNNSGQLGNGDSASKENGYYTYSAVPIKIMDNVKSISLGYWHSGAVTKDDNLYMWGCNTNCQFGNGTYKGSTTPIKIEIPSTSNLSTVVTPVYSLLASENSQLKTQSFKDLMPNEVYNFYMLKSEDSEELLSSDNLLYITQAVSDENGNMSISYLPKVDCNTAVILTKPMSQTDISGAEVTVPNIPLKGNDQLVKPVVTLNGVTLTEGDDYEIEGDYKAAAPGKYEITISGINDCCGNTNAVYSAYYLGDANSDDKISAVDASVIFSEYKKIYRDGVGAFTDEDILRCDSNGDGKITAVDASYAFSRYKEIYNSK